MADVTDQEEVVEDQQPEASEFQKYLTGNPELGREMAKIITELYI